MEAIAKRDLRAASPDEIKAFLVEVGEKPFRAKQVQEWLWKKAAHSIDEMTNISRSTRERLAEAYEIRPVTTHQMQVSEDGTVKFSFRTHDGHFVEGVLIPTDTRMTACISSQVGCSLTCAFCATGRLKMLRNLGADEIFDQVVIIAREAQERYGIALSNIVYMGMGEPLLNYRNVLESVAHITSPHGLGMSPQRITVSTAGIAKMIRKLADDKVKFNLALSLHAADDEKRSRIMPINDTNSLDVLAGALQHFYNETGTRPTLEYVALNGVNDTQADADQLYAFWKRVPSKINVIEYNPIEGGEFEKSRSEVIDAFCKRLSDRGVIVNVRRSRGKDIDAACGQLANRVQG
jgi:23S rRNA (adenine2503-C2)-methyltransferase